MGVVNSESAASRLAAEGNWSDFHGHKWLWAEFWRRNSKGICGPEGKYKAKPRGDDAQIYAQRNAPRTESLETSQAQKSTDDQRIFSSE